MYLDGAPAPWLAEDASQLPAQQVVAVEIYRNYTEVPIEFGGGRACAAVLVWTHREHLGPRLTLGPVGGYALATAGGRGRNGGPRPLAPGPWWAESSGEQSPAVPGHPASGTGWPGVSPASPRYAPRPTGPRHGVEGAFRSDRLRVEGYAPLFR